MTIQPISEFWLWITRFNPNVLLRRLFRARYNVVLDETYCMTVAQLTNPRSELLVRSFKSTMAYVADIALMTKLEVVRSAWERNVQSIVQTVYNYGSLVISLRRSLIIFSRVSCNREKWNWMTGGELACSWIIQCTSFQLWWHTLAHTHGWIANCYWVIYFKDEKRLCYLLWTGGEITTIVCRTH